MATDQQIQPQKSINDEEANKVNSPALVANAKNMQSSTKTNPPEAEETKKLKQSSSNKKKNGGSNDEANAVPLTLHYDAQATEEKEQAEEPKGFFG